MNDFDLNGLMQQPEFWPVISAAVIIILFLLIALKRVLTGAGDAVGRVPLMPVCGWLLILGGVAGAIYFFGFFDPSVPVSSNILGIDRVNNMGLMQQRQNGILISLAGVIVGVILVVAHAFLEKKNTP